MDVAAEIRHRLAALEPARLQITDDSSRHAGHAGARPGGQSHFTIVIYTTAFRGLGPIQRHRRIYDLLADLMPTPIHALVIHAHAVPE